MNTKDNIWIEGFDSEGHMYATRDFAIMKGFEPIWIGHREDLPEDIAKECVGKVFEGTDQEMYQSYYPNDGYCLTAKESVQEAATNKEWILIYKKNNSITDCKFINCALNSGNGGCVSTLTKDQKCTEIPKQFLEI